MDKQTFNDALLGMLNSAIAAVEKGASFLAGEIPDVIHQLLLYKLVVALLPWAGLVIFGSIGGYLLVKAMRMASRKQAAHALWLRSHKRHVEERMKNLHDRCDTWETIFGIAGAVFLGVAVICAVSAIMMIGDAIQIAIAPKVYLLEYAAQFIK